MPCLTEPFIIDHSCRIYISENGTLLKEIDSTFLQKQGEFYFSYDSVIYKEGQLNPDEIRKLG